MRKWGALLALHLLVGYAGWLTFDRSLSVSNQLSASVARLVVAEGELACSSSLSYFDSIVVGPTVRIKPAEPFLNEEFKESSLESKHGTVSERTSERSYTESFPCLNSVLPRTIRVLDSVKEDFKGREFFLSPGVDPIFQFVLPSALTVEVLGVDAKSLFEPRLPEYLESILAMQASSGQTLHSDNAETNLPKI